MKLIYSKKCEEYWSEGHPESPDRTRIIHEHLKEKGFSFTEPKQASDRDILKAHSKSLIESIKNNSFFDYDTPNIENIYNYAKLSAGAAITAAKLSKDEFAFSLMRPPGHHAGKNSLGGFCYLNNIAIAIKGLGERAAILDIDLHHGNGTQDIFMRDKNVLYVSLHRGDIYPGTGHESIENCINYPFYERVGEKEYLRTVDEAIKKIKEFNAKVIGISLGFDTYKKEFLAGDRGMNLELSTYKEIAKRIKQLEIPSFAVLEGGYHEDLGLCAEKFLEVWE
ncbi:histone deacetylase [Candidatus Micrarchaeota archaeon]|nr:MAG: histone deacetylase [Candidatus Micrarchaeota archaeon]